MTDKPSSPTTKSNRRQTIIELLVIIFYLFIFDKIFDLSQTLWPTTSFFQTIILLDLCIGSLTLIYSYARYDTIIFIIYVCFVIINISFFVVVVCCRDRHYSVFNYYINFPFFLHFNFKLHFVRLISLIFVSTTEKNVDQNVFFV